MPEGKIDKRKKTWSRKKKRFRKKCAERIKNRITKNVKTKEKTGARKKIQKNKKIRARNKSGPKKGGAQKMYEAEKRCCEELKGFNRKRDGSEKPTHRPEKIHGPRGKNGLEKKRIKVWATGKKRVEKRIVCAPRRPINVSMRFQIRIQFTRRRAYYTTSTKNRT